MSSDVDGPHLEEISGGKKHLLECNKDFTIGRSLDNNLTIEDLKISRTHCRLKDLSGIWSVIDESANGLYVNEKRIPRNQQHVLSNGDTIKLSDQVQFKFIEGRSQIAAEMEICDALDQIEAEHKYAEATNKDVNSGECSSSKKKPDLESDLQCSICTELFVKAQTLNCSHSYCKNCIEQWRKNHKICPICRATIISVVPSIVVDNLINTIVESSSEEVKENRRQVLEEHKKKEEVKKPAAKPKRGRGRGTARNTRSTNNRLNEELVTVLLSSESESDDSDHLYWYDLAADTSADDLDDSYIPGDPHVYYGGYGSCFNCGARGHWANGCPLR